MRAGWFERNGPAQEVLILGEMPDPLPGEGEVRVRIAYSGVNPTDVKRRAGVIKLAYPRSIPNMDGSGVIDCVGPGVDAARKGERVWLHGTAYKRPFGTAAEYAVTPANRAHRLPEGVSFAVGASLGVPAMTAHRAVFGTGQVRGKTVLVTGGAGAVGCYAVQLAKWGGAKVLASVSSGDKARLAAAAGADAVIDYRREDVAQAVMAATQGEGVDHIVEVDFAANLAATLAVLKTNGSIATYDSMSNPQPVIPFHALMHKNARLLWVGVYEMPRAAKDEAVRDITSWLKQGPFTPLPVHNFPLDRLADAHIAVERAAVGKVIVEIGGEKTAAA